MSVLGIYPDHTQIWSFTWETGGLLRKTLLIFSIPVEDMLLPLEEPYLLLMFGGGKNLIPGTVWLGS